jgi:predicted transposase/invertase (TIGR01784 family)
MTIGTGIDPKVDYAFKRIAGSEGSEDITAELVNSVMDRAKLSRVKDIRILNPFRPKESPDGRLAILDVSARDEDGTDLLIEMQMLSHESFRERLMYYLAKHYSQSLTEGQHYIDLPSVHVICIINDVLFAEHSHYYSRYRLIEPEIGTEFSPHWTIHVIELPKFTRPLHDLHDDLDRWCFFLKHGADLSPQSPPSEVSLPGIHHALRILNMVSQSSLERLEYEARLMSQRDEAARIATALSRGHQMGRDQGLVEGIEQGIERGIEQGLVQGLDRGRLVGLADHAQTSLLRVGNRLLGTPPEAVRTTITGLTDVELLDRMSDMVFEVTSWDELKQRAGLK